MIRNPSSSERAVFVTICILMGAAAVLESLMGRTLWGTSGVAGLWSGDIWSSHNSQFLFDPYTFTHITHGVLLYGLLAVLAKALPISTRLVLAVALESAWEVFENTKFVIDKYRTETAALGYTGDTIVNSLGDLACALAGFLLARQLGVRRSLIVFALVELVLTLWIHDSLLLQILMLVRPVEALKSWQMCL